MKKMTSIVLLLTMVFLLLPKMGISVFAGTNNDLTEGIFTYSVYNGEATLKSCKSLHTPTDVTIPDKLGGYPVTKIEQFAFGNCPNARNVVLPKYLKTIMHRAFYSRHLESVVFPDGLTTIDSYVFEHSTIYEIVLPDSVTTIGPYAFAACKAEKIVIPKELTVLEEGVFSYNNITELTIPENITAIKANAFMANNNLKKVHISKNVSSIEGNIFRECYNLESITVDSENPYFTAKDGCLIDKKNQILLCYPTLKKDKSFTIPNGVKTIAKDAFNSNAFLEEIIIPNSVKKIEETAFRGIHTLKTVILGDGVQEVGKEVFRWCDNLEYVWLGTSIPELSEGMFQNCSSLKHIVIPESVKRIKTNAFRSMGLESLMLGDGVETIETGAFSCDSLKTVVFGNKITSIGGYWLNVEKMVIPTSVKTMGGIYKPFGLEIYYKGSLSQWLDIEKSAYSLYDLENATKHYNYNGENERVKASSVTCSSENESTTVSVQFETVSWACTAYVCVYDAEGKLLKTVSESLGEDDTELQVVIPEEFPSGSKVKVFFWENMISLNPYGMPIETTIS